MDITESLTKKLNIKGLKSWLEVDNMVLDKLQQERSDLREHLVSIYLTNLSIYLSISSLGKKIKH